MWSNGCSLSGMIVRTQLFTPGHCLKWSCSLSGMIVRTHLCSHQASKWSCSLSGMIVRTHLVTPGIKVELLTLWYDSQNSSGHTRHQSGAAHSLVFLQDSQNSAVQKHQASKWSCSLSGTESVIKLRLSCSHHASKWSCSLCSVCMPIWYSAYRCRRMLFA